MAKDKIAKAFLAITKDKFTIDTIAEMIATKHLAEGDVVRLNGYYSAGDGANHIRKISKTDDGSGVQLANGLYANIVHSGEVNASWFGAKGDGVADDTVAIQKSINTADTNLENKTFKCLETLYLSKSFSIKNGGFIFENQTGNTFIITASDVVLKELEVSGNTVGVFSLKNGANNVTFDGVTFSGTLNQNIWLFDCSNIKVFNCNFLNVGYGVIQQNGYSSNNVVVHGNYIFNSINDFVECNCEHTAPSKNWVISNNVFTSDTSPTLPHQIENRFVGTTFVDNLVITGNTIENVKGDGAIHIEGSSTKVVIGSNTFKNCFGEGYIYLTSKGHKTIISNNFFSSDILNGKQKIVFTGYGAYEGDLVFEGNIIEDKTSNKTAFIDVLAINNSSNFLINGNTVLNCNNFINMYVCSKLIITNNKLYNTPLFKIAGDNYTYSKMIISNNFIEAENEGIEIDTNTSGTLTPSNILITSNYLDCKVSVDNVKNCIFSSNLINYDKFIKVQAGYYGENMNGKGNAFFGTVNKSFDLNFALDISRLDKNKNATNGYQMWSDDYKRPYYYVDGSWKYVDLSPQPTHIALDTPYHASNMQKLGILDSYHNYLTELHQYEKSKNVPEGVMNLNIVQPPVIPKEVEEYAKEYNLL